MMAARNIKILPLYDAQACRNADMITPFKCERCKAERNPLRPAINCSV